MLKKFNNGKGLRVFHTLRSPYHSDCDNNISFVLSFRARRGERANREREQQAGVFSGWLQHGQQKEVYTVSVQMLFAFMKNKNVAVEKAGAVPAYMQIENTSHLPGAVRLIQTAVFCFLKDFTQQKSFQKISTATKYKNTKDSRIKQFSQERNQK